MHRAEKQPQSWLAHARPSNGCLIIEPKPPRDVNSDGCSSMPDIILIGECFGEVGDPCWIRQDVNRDGLISVLDIIQVGQNCRDGCNQG